MAGKDSHTPDEPTYECVECSYQTTGKETRCCPECGAELRNISIPRE